MKEGKPASLEEVIWKLLEGAEEALDELCDRVAKCFYRSEHRHRFRRYLIGLLSFVGRRNGWQMAEEIGDQTPDGIHRLLRTASWSANELRDELREYVYNELQAPDGVLIVDETGFLKKGTESVGVKRQYSGTAGKVENCQVGVFLCYSSKKGVAFIDRELYLPQEWAEDQKRRKKAGVPDKVTFATKPQLAQKMLIQADEKGVKVAWVLADEFYGSNPAFRADLEARKQAYVVAVRSNEVVWVNRGHGPALEAVSEITARLPAVAWKRRSAGEGTKGLRVYDWAWMPLVGDEDPQTEPEPEWETGLLIRRSLDEAKELAFYRVFCRAETSFEAIVLATGRRWGIESGLEDAKGEVGWDEYEVRTWTAWYRFITIALLVHASLAVLRARVTFPSFASQEASLIPQSDFAYQDPLVTPSEIIESSSSPLPEFLSSDLFPSSCPPISSRNLPMKKGEELPRLEVQKGLLLRMTEWVPLSLPEIRRLLTKIVWPCFPHVPFIFHWSVWRRLHQTKARFFHYRRRLLNLLA